MSFRKIHPNPRVPGEASSSSTNPSQSTSESTGSDPRQLRGVQSDAPESASLSKKRRVPESVTRNACLNCKKARAKCDGRNPCKRCSARSETEGCVYETHVKHAKEELVKEIKELRDRDLVTEHILSALSTDEKVPEILEKLQRGETYDSIAEWLGRPPMVDVDTLSPRESHISLHETSDHEMGGTASATFRWTTVTSDQVVLDHLFQLYFAWVHPVHTLFHEGQFVNSYKTEADRYCSPVLVNAICAMACHLHTTVDGDDTDFKRLGTKFSEAVGLTIDAEDRSIATIQAFAIMFLVHLARSNALRASSFLQIAVSGLAGVQHQDDDGGFSEVWRDTVRGVRNLSVEWAQVTFQIPPVIPDAPSLESEQNDRDSDDAQWYFYRYLNNQPPSWPGLLATTNREKSKLTALIYDMVKMLYGQGGAQVSAVGVLQQYDRFVTWREQLPKSIGSPEKNKDQALPHTLSLLILYSASMIQLLRPLLSLRGFPVWQVEEIIWRHAQQGLFFLDEQYHTKYNCRYQPALQMFSMLHLSNVIARFFPGGRGGRGRDGPEAIKFGLTSLMHSRAGFPVAGPLQEMLRITAEQYSLQLPPTITQKVLASRPRHEPYRLDDLIDACTRPMYTQPVKQIASRYDSSFVREWMVDAVNFGFPESTAGPEYTVTPSAEERGAQSLMHISNLLNTG